MGLVFKLAVVVVVVGGTGVAADRLAVHAADNRIASVVQADVHLAARPKVTVEGFPFLTQVAAGKYPHIVVRAGDVFADDPGGGATLRLDFFNARIPASKVLHGQVSTVPVQHVTGSMDVPFTQLSAASGVAGLSGLSAVPDESDEIQLAETVQVASVSVPAQLVARISVANDSISVAPVSVTAAGLTPIPASVSGAVLAKAAFSVKLPGLPDGVQLTGFTIDASGISVTMSADALVLSK
jgi:hypothetical protein